MFFWYKDCLIDATFSKKHEVGTKTLVCESSTRIGGGGSRFTTYKDASLLYCMRRHISCLVLPVAQSDLLRIPLIRHTPITTKTASYSLFNKMYVGMG